MVAVGAEEFLRGGRDEGRYLTVSLLFFLVLEDGEQKKAQRQKKHLALTVLH